MNDMKGLLVRSFELWCKRRWLKAIAKEITRREKLQAKLTHQTYIVKALYQRYEELFEGEKL